MFGREIITAAALVSFAVVLVGTPSAMTYTDTAIVITFLANGIFAIALLSRYLWKDGLSMAAIYGYFCYFFAFSVPLACYVHGLWLKANLSSTAGGILLKANLLILAFNIIWYFSYLVGRRRYSQSRESRWLRQLDGEISASRALLVTVILSFLALFLVAMMGTSLVYRGAVAENSLALSGGKAVGMLLGGVIRPLFVFFAIVLWAAWKNGRKDLFPLAVWNSVLALVCNFPTSLSRFYIFVIIATAVVALGAGSRWFRSVSVALLALGTFGAILWHPIRWLGTSVMDNDRIGAQMVSKVSFDYFFEGHYDAYENFVLGMELIERDGLTWGRQLSGVLLAWVPRQIWAEKPLDTGEFLVEEYTGEATGSSYANIAAPVYLEMYVNFGAMALLVGAYVAGSFCSYVDIALKRIRISRIDGPEVRRHALSLTFLGAVTGLSLFIWRGSWMTGYTMFLGICLCMIIVRIGVIKRVRTKWVSTSLS